MARKKRDDWEVRVEVDSSTIRRNWRGKTLPNGYRGAVFNNGALFGYTFDLTESGAIRKAREWRDATRANRLDNKNPKVVRL